MFRMKSDRDLGWPRFALKPKLAIRIGNPGSRIRVPPFPPRLRGSNFQDQEKSPPLVFKDTAAHEGKKNRRGSDCGKAGSLCGTGVCRCGIAVNAGKKDNKGREG